MCRNIFSIVILLSCVLLPLRVKDPGLTIVLLGNSGVGKSASGNTILGGDIFESRRCFKSVTTQISDPKTETLFGKQISVIDTPGIFGSERQIQTMCRSLLQSSRPCLFLVVVKIDRFTDEQKRAVEESVRLINDLSDQSFRSSYLLFTGGDDLRSMTLDDFINEDPDGPLQPVIQCFEGRLHVFNNENGGQDQVRELLEKSGHLGSAGSSSNEPNLRIVLLGVPGVGKSASGNTILGSPCFQSGDGLNPVTTRTVSEEAMVAGRQIKVVDTPGISDKTLSPKQMYYEIMASLEEASPGPHAFLIVVDATARITDGHLLLFQMLRKIFGKHTEKYVMVLFTHGDQLRGQGIEDVIQSNDSIKQLVSSCGNRYAVLDNTRRTNRVQVRRLLGQIDRMVRAYNGEHYTSELFYNIQTWDVKLGILWENIKEWFIEKLERLRTMLSQGQRYRAAYVPLA